MGFLDFLKKPTQQPLPAPAISLPQQDITKVIPPQKEILSSQDFSMLTKNEHYDEPTPVVHYDDELPLPPPPGAPIVKINVKIDDKESSISKRQTPQQKNVSSQENAPLQKNDSSTKPEDPVPTAVMLAGPLHREKIPEELENDDDYEAVPLPPVNPKDPGFLDSAAADFANPKSQTKIVEVDVPELITLPDFTEEDLSVLEQPPERVLEEEPPQLERRKEVQTIASSANVIARPKEGDMLPVGEMANLEELEPSRFISSRSYFTMFDDYKGIRRSLREGDEMLKEALLRHEQLDQQHKRVALDMNTVQENLIKIDEALFED